MSDRKIAKNRHHRGLTAHLRKVMRRAGLALDEEAAQFALSGMTTVGGQVSEMLTEVIDETLARKRELMRMWEFENPKKNPYAPSFPERAIRLVNDALQACYTDDASPETVLLKLKAMCERELEAEPDTTYPLPLD